MTIIDMLRGRPSVERVAAIVGEADALVDTDPDQAHKRLRELGSRPWFRAPDSQRIAYGFALRAYAGWRRHDMAAAKPDMRDAFAISPLADPLLPLVPVISDEDAGLSGLRARALVDRFGGCGRGTCEHPIGLEAALGVINAADNAAETVRWATRANGHADASALRIAAHGRAWQLGARAEAERALDGPGERLLDARARVEHDLGNYAAVLRMVPPDHVLAVRSSLRLLLAGSAIPDANAAVIQSLSASDPTVAALVAEAEGRYRDAATTWKRAGQPLRAWEAEALAGPSRVGQPPSQAGLHVGTAWFVHAGGAAPRPAADPETDVDRDNATVGEQRDALRSVREAGGLPGRQLAEPRIERLNQVLAAVASGTTHAGAMLAAAAPDAPPLELLDSFATTPSGRRMDPAAGWETWARGHENVAPLPRRTDPLTWLAARNGYAPPARDDIAALPHDQRLPVLAALLITGSSFARAVGSNAITAEALGTSLPQALPDLPALAAAVSSCADLDAPTRRRASVVACAALANGVVRGAWSQDAAEAAARRVTAAVADLLPDPDELTADEAFRIEADALAVFPETTRRRAIGPVLRELAGLPVPARPPKGVARLYRAEPAQAALLLAAGRPEAARRASAASARADAGLLADIAAAMADRHLSAGRPVDALSELAAIPGAELKGVDTELLDRVAAAIVRDRREVPVEDVLRDADRLLKALPRLPSVGTMVVELLLARTAARPGSAALDVPDLERAYSIDPDHPAVKRSLAGALVVRGMETVETRPTQAVADVDRATDLYMADAQLAEVASMVALRAGGILWSKQRNRGAAAQAIAVSLAINPHNTDALAARRVVRGY